MGLLPEATSSVPLITFLNSNKRRIENIDQIHAHLQNRFPHAMFTSLESSEGEALSIREQVTSCVLVLRSVLVLYASRRASSTTKPCCLCSSLLPDYLYPVTAVCGFQYATDCMTLVSNANIGKSTHVQCMYRCVAYVASP